jgi:hypothetical protein
MRYRNLGIDDPCAIWCFQVEPGRVNVVDYYGSSAQGMQHYVDWLNERGYKGVDVLAQDAKNPGFGYGRTRIETQAVEARAHVGMAACHPYPRASRQRDNRSRPPASVAIVVVSLSAWADRLVR